ncbi:MAG: hypothetical protein WC829_03415 [Hyphomicrobium sp.]|jgi:hypothetical protein
MLEHLTELFTQLIDAIKKTPTFEWGEVTGATPLTVKLDGDADNMPGTPATLVSGLQVGDRVMVLSQHRRNTIIGRGGG